jgi:hypothetical protein
MWTAWTPMAAKNIAANAHHAENRMRLLDIAHSTPAQEPAGITLYYIPQRKTQVKRGNQDTP